VRIFKTKPFARFAKWAGIGDAMLCQVIEDMEQGRVGADLGGGIIKQRLARPGQGKSSGFRTMIVCRKDVRAVFVHGFAKSDRDNIQRAELTALRKLASELLAYDDQAIAKAVAYGALLEVMRNEEAIS
jgi:hypothetical protein